MVDVTANAPVLTERFERAFGLAAGIHAAQVRKGTGVPYLSHLMSVAALVLEYGGGEDAAIAGLLHDAVEDSADGAATAARIRAEFGATIADIVLACSDAVAMPGRAKPPWQDRKASYITHIAAETDPAVLLVSACDKLHNARSIVADLRSLGPALWDRFGQKDPAAHLWYYRSLAACFAGRVPDGLSGELDRVIADMTALAERS